MIKRHKRKQYTATQRTAVYDMCNGCCGYCGREMSQSEMQIDHMNPFEDGGSNDMSNLLPSCKRCNAMKGKRTVDGFRRHIEELPRKLGRRDRAVKLAMDFGSLSDERVSVTFYYEEMS